MEISTSYRLPEVQSMFLKAELKIQTFPMHPIPYDVLLFMVLETTFMSNEHSQRGLTGLNLNENAMK